MIRIDLGPISSHKDYYEAIKKVNEQLLILRTANYPDGPETHRLYGQLNALHAMRPFVETWPDIKAHGPDDGDSLG